MKSHLGLLEGLLGPGPSKAEKHRETPQKRKRRIVRRTRQKRLRKRIRELRRLVPLQSGLKMRGTAKLLNPKKQRRLRPKNRRLKKRKRRKKEARTRERPEEDANNKFVYRRAE